jgi:hypothetical protein
MATHQIAFGVTIKHAVFPIKPVMKRNIVKRKKFSVVGTLYGQQAILA